LEIVPDPEPPDWRRWQGNIEMKDAPILEAAVTAGVDRLLSLNTKDFTSAVSSESGSIIQTPAEFITDLRDLATQHL
jgi:hypothetical protein